ncbi:MAG: hypothetical protein QM747_21820 [Nocardioides sp.]
MTATTATLEDLLRPGHDRTQIGAWRWSVRRLLVPVRDRLLREHPVRREAWLSARAVRATRERDELIARLNGLAAQVLVAPDVDDLAERLSRLLADIARHHQRVDDLAWDDVELEIGGSE